MEINIQNLSFHRKSHNKQTSWWFHDAKGIPLCRVCSQCVHLMEEIYDPEVLGTKGRYEDVVDEQIEPDY